MYIATYIICTLSYVKHFSFKLRHTYTQICICKISDLHNKDLCILLSSVGQVLSGYVKYKQSTRLIIRALSNCHYTDRCLEMLVYFHLFTAEQLVNESRSKEKQLTMYLFQSKIDISTSRH